MSERNPWLRSLPRACPSGRIIVDAARGVRVCADTGEVIDEQLVDDGKDWREFQNQVKGSIRAPPPRNPIATYKPSVLIKPKGKSARDFARNIRLRGGRSRGIRRRPIALSDNSRKDEALRDMLSKAGEVLRRLGEERVLAPAVAYIIKAYYKARRESKENGGTAVINGRERWGVVFYAVSKAASLHNRPIPEQHIIDVIRSIDSNIDEDTLKTMRWRVSRRVAEFRILNNTITTVRLGKSRSASRNVDRARSFILSIARSLGLDLKVALAASKFLEMASKNGKTLEGRRPEAVAAAAIYLMARITGNDWITQQTVAREAMVKEANIRKTFKYLLRDYVIIVFI